MGQQDDQLLARVDDLAVAKAAGVGQFHHLPLGMLHDVVHTNELILYVGGLLADSLGQDDLEQVGVTAQGALDGCCVGSRGTARGDDLVAPVHQGEGQHFDQSLVRQWDIPAANDGDFLGLLLQHGQLGSEIVVRIRRILVDFLGGQGHGDDLLFAFAFVTGAQQVGENIYRDHIVKVLMHGSLSSEISTVSAPRTPFAAVPPILRACKVKVRLQAIDKRPGQPLYYRKTRALRHLPKRFLIPAAGRTMWERPSKKSTGDREA